MVVMGRDLRDRTLRTKMGGMPHSRTVRGLLCPACAEPPTAAGVPAVCATARAVGVAYPFGWETGAIGMPGAMVAPATIVTHSW